MCVRRAGFHARDPPTSSLSVCRSDRESDDAQGGRKRCHFKLLPPFLGSPRGTRRPLSRPLTDRFCTFTLCWRCWPTPKRLLRSFGAPTAQQRTPPPTLEASHVKLLAHRSTKQGAKARTGGGSGHPRHPPRLLPYVERGAWGPPGCRMGAWLFNLRPGSLETLQPLAVRLRQRRRAKARDATGSALMTHGFAPFVVFVAVARKSIPVTRTWGVNEQRPQPQNSDHPGRARHAPD